MEKSIEKLIHESLHNALKGDLFESLRGVTIDYNENSITMLFYINGKINDETIEYVDSIDTYFLSHMPDYFKSNYKIISCNSFSEMKSLKEWFYLK